MNKEELVELSAYIPGILVELRYATKDNFTGKVIYSFSDARLRRGTADKLKHAQDALAALGYTLKVWDAYRPAAAQFTLYEACPMDEFVKNPHTGFSDHSRGNAVDVTLCRLLGEELTMPTGFDDFSPAASRSNLHDGSEGGKNALLLEEIMERYGFTGLPSEWWHFADREEYPVIQRE